MHDNFLGSEGLLSPSDAAVGLIHLDDGRYLCQLRSQLPRIFYPDHWGLFGGGVEPGETAEEALKRELWEELAFEVRDPVYFTEFTFDFPFRGLGVVWRRFYLVSLPAAKLPELRLGEGREMRAFTARELHMQQRVVPYDAFAVWLHATQQLPAASGFIA